MFKISALACQHHLYFFYRQYIEHSSLDILNEFDYMLLKHSSVFSVFFSSRIADLLIISSFIFKVLNYKLFLSDFLIVIFIVINYSAVYNRLDSQFILSLCVTFNSFSIFNCEKLRRKYVTMIVKILTNKIHLKDCSTEKKQRTRSCLINRLLLLACGF